MRYITQDNPRQSLKVCEFVESLLQLLIDIFAENLTSNMFTSSIFKLYYVDSTAECIRGNIWKRKQ